MGARKDMAKSFSRMTQEEVDLFCMEWGIGTKFIPVAPVCDKSIDKCPSGSIALYCRHFEFSNLRHPFSNFVLNVLEYYRISFGQVHPLGMARVLHFEILCRASRCDPTLLSFRRFFRLAKNGDWFTFETTQVDTCLISSMVSTLGVLKDRFFWVSEEIVPFKLVWRHPDAVLNEPKPSVFEINTRPQIESLVPDNPRDCVQGSQRSYQTVFETMCDLSSGTEFFNKIFLFVLVGLILLSAFDRTVE
ncbi:hypothetical protein Hanom_Chr12g01144771 [Helianthus anomalus]